MRCVSLLCQCKLSKQGEDLALAATFCRQALGMLMLLLATAACAFCSAEVTVSYKSQYRLDDCAADQFYCSGGCYLVTCGTLAMLTTSAAPTILLSAEAKAALNSSLELIVMYATPVAFNLLPCPSTGRPYHQAHHCLLLSVMLHLSLSFSAQLSHSPPMKASWLPNHGDL